MCGLRLSTQNMANKKNVEALKIIQEFQSELTPIVKEYPIINQLIMLPISKVLNLECTV